jgi:hypothetical protein
MDFTTRIKIWVQRRKGILRASWRVGVEADLWLTLVGNADEDRKGPGPPQRTAGDIVLAVDSYFEVLSLISSHFGSNRPNAHRALRCLIVKRLVA